MVNIIARSVGHTWTTTSNELLILGDLELAHPDANPEQNDEVP